jgi:hypothetical protein
VWLSGSLEILASATNLQWHLAVLTLVILALPAPLTGAGRAVSRAMLLLAGLTGVPSAFWVPSYAVRAYFETDRERAIQFGLLAVAAFVQGGLILANSTGSRPIRLDPEGIASWTIIQFAVSPLMGGAAADMASRLLMTTKEHLQLAKWTAVLAGTGAIAAVMALIANRGQAAARALVLGSVISLLLGLAGSLAPAGRYFYAAQVAFLLALLLAGARGDSKSFRVAGIGILIVVILRGFSPGSSSKTFFEATEGPPWREQVHEIEESQCTPCRIEIWPKGWVMELRRDYGEQ